MKRIISIFLLITAAALVFADSEDLELYSYLYNGANSYTDKLGILQAVAESETSGAGAFYAEVLHSLVADYQNIKNVGEKAAAEEQAKVLSEKLGDEKYTASGADIWWVAENFQDPLVRAEALMALGKIQATAFLPQVITVLNNLNVSPAKDRLTAERIAYGAIISLEKYGDVSGYIPVYFASTGWYQDRIKSQALRSLQVISPEPSEPLTQIIKSQGYSYPVKLQALQIEEASGASNQSKAEVALAAYTEGWSSRNSDRSLQGTLYTIRDLSMNMLKRYGTQDAAVYTLLERSYREGLGSDSNTESINAIATLTALGTDESVNRLNKYLMELNTKMQSGTLNTRDRVMVRTIIPALGATKSSKAGVVLRAVLALNWESGIKKLAEDALKEIQ